MRCTLCVVLLCALCSPLAAQEAPEQPDWSSQLAQHKSAATECSDVLWCSDDEEGCVCTCSELGVTVTCTEQINGYAPTASAITTLTTPEGVIATVFETQDGLQRVQVYAEPCEFPIFGDCPPPTETRF